MSGGSFSYLYERTSDGGNIGYAEEYERVAASDTLEKHPDAVAALRKLAEARRALIKHHDALRDIMHAVEWVHSSDWAQDQLDAVIVKWRTANGG